MNTNSSEPSGHNDLFRWYAHPLTSIIVVAVLTIAFVHTINVPFAVTAFAAMLKVVADIAAADRRGPAEDDPTVPV